MTSTNIYIFNPLRFTLCIILIVLCSCQSSDYLAHLSHNILTQQNDTQNRSMSTSRFNHTHRQGVKPQDPVYFLKPKTNDWEGLMEAATEALTSGLLKMRDARSIPHSFNVVHPPKNHTRLVSRQQKRMNNLPRRWRRVLQRTKRKAKNKSLKDLMNTVNKGEQKKTKHVDKMEMTMFHEMMIRCLPINDDTAEVGYYQIFQNNNFTLHCKEGKTRPLYSYERWTCNQSVPFEPDYYVPTMCVEKHLPKLVTLTRRATLYSLTDAGCGMIADLGLLNFAWNDVLAANGSSTTFTIDNVKFKYREYISGGACNGTFVEMNLFKMKVGITFQIQHVPVSYKLKDTHRVELQKILDDKAMELLVLLSLRGMIESFTLESDDLRFKASECKQPGTAVEQRERLFTDTIPPCRACDRGLYLDQTKKKCFRCPVGYYSESGATSCTTCPIATEHAQVSADSSHDCYATPICQTCFWESTKEGVIIMATYHAVIVTILVWNIRTSIPGNKGNNPVPGTPVRRQSTVM